jgi:hypothetical protein
LTITDAVGITDTANGIVPAIIAILLSDDVTISDVISGIKTISIAKVNEIRATLRYNAGIQYTARITPVLQTVQRITSEIRKTLRM